MTVPLEIVALVSALIGFATAAALVFLVYRWRLRGQDMYVPPGHLESIAPHPFPDAGGEVSREVKPPRPRKMGGWSEGAPLNEDFGKGLG